MSRSSHHAAGARQHIGTTIAMCLFAIVVLVASRWFGTAHAATAATEAATASLLPAAASLASGLALAGGSIAALMALRERDGKAHWLTTIPVMESMVPIAITGGLVFGVALIITGVANLF
jgi:hypothetical protein